MTLFLRKVANLARVTFLEGVRTRALMGVFIFSVLMLFANISFGNFFMRDIGKVAVDVGLATVSFAGVLLVVFVGIQLLARDLDKKTVFVVISRPVSRSQYILGKYLGLLLLLAASTAALGAVALGSVLVAKLQWPHYFPPNFSWASVVLALFSIFIALALLAAVTVFFASFTTSSFLTLALTCVVYLLGRSLENLKTILEVEGAKELKLSPAFEKLVSFIYYLFPNFSALDLSTFAAHGMAVDLGYLAFAVAYALIYITLLLAAATLAFERREFL